MWSLCQMAVTLQYATQPADKAQGGEVFCVDTRLFLPEKEWGNDRGRMTKAGVPPEVMGEELWRGNPPAVRLWRSGRGDLARRSTPRR